MGVRCVLNDSVCAIVSQIPYAILLCTFIFVILLYKMRDDKTLSQNLMLSDWMPCEGQHSYMTNINTRYQLILLCSVSIYICAHVACGACCFCQIIEINIRKNVRKKIFFCILFVKSLPFIPHIITFLLLVAKVKKTNKYIYIFVGGTVLTLSITHHGPVSIFPDLLLVLLCLPEPLRQLYKPPFKFSWATRCNSPVWKGNHCSFHPRLSTAYSNPIMI